MNQINFKTEELMILLCACLAQFVASADNMSTALLIKEIMAFFDINLSLGQVVTASYSIVSASLMLVSGLLGYYFSWKKVFQAGLTFCVLGEVLVLFVHDVWLFIILSRGVVGLGAALILPSCIALITTQVQRNNRVMTFSIWGTSVALVIAVYPTVLTILNNLSGWRAGFTFLGLVAAFVLLLSMKLPDTPPVRSKKRIDKLGTVYIVFAIGFLLTAMTFAPSLGFFEPKKDVLILGVNLSRFGIAIPMQLVFLASLFFFAFILKNKSNNKGHIHAVIPSSFLKIEVLAGLYILLLLYVIYGGILFSLISYISLGSYSKVDLATAVTSFAVTMFTTSVIVAFKGKDLSIKKLNTMGLLLLVCSMSLLALTIQPRTSIGTIVFCVSLIGCACGMIATKSNVAVNCAVGAQYAEQSSGAQVSAKNIGYVIGVALFGWMLTVVAQYELSNTMSSLSQSIDIIGLHDSLNFMSNEQLNETLIKYGIEPIKTFNQINNTARASALKQALFIGSAICFFSIPIGRSVVNE